MIARGGAWGVEVGRLFCCPYPQPCWNVGTGGGLRLGGIVLCIGRLLLLQWQLLLLLPIDRLLLLRLLKSLLLLMLLLLWLLLDLGLAVTVRVLVKASTHL